ncbi:hypothetical protein LTR35_013215 [Friedmanniomyces endolithicus]|uniref:Uncharacterized protein n=1 Tax=Friedmanniomyces endolithicus TaxID=329885 RepID=A0AAN6FDN1_9PEZI|nr:hypothetical protein LTS00_016584 [Friedmanniomyces endolithicus]KAK0271739.1 hypothetical protein LTR35_013215 [Friedmanniomyces endolithicus]KAK0315208.1 hypothetical protein LTR82_012535 [Friedmanniomyces endolithicus]KAK0988232.1 hypothetical protein LTR54_012940 [Friedmanniomyces endolithicus]
MASKEVIREATHADSWYSASKSQLNSQLDGWLAAVKTPVKCIGPRTEGQSTAELPVPGARVIIAPHAGYSYSGPAAAWAYRSWDISKAKRIFLLGPSHHHYLTKAALTRCTHYATPLGNLSIDRETTAELHKTGHFEWMSQSVDEDEHSLEMHLPYIYKMLSKTYGTNPTNFPPLTPILIGNTSIPTETTLGRLLAPYLADPTTAFVISSDFAHWGLRFSYTLYRSPGSPQTSLTKSSPPPRNPAIHESIKRVDFECMGACESGSHMAWLEALEETGNTVCGRHPIGVVMAGVEEVRKRGGEGRERVGCFRFVRYERSGEVERVGESSVSYASAYAVM